MWWYAIGRSTQYFCSRSMSKLYETALLRAWMRSSARGDTLNGDSPGGQPSDFCEHEYA